MKGRQSYGPPPLRVFGIHSPECERERDPATVAAKTREFGLHHPEMIDNDFAYWRALNKKYWPAFYLIDKRGKLRNRFVGKTHKGESQGREIEAAIKELLVDPA
jgi:hypothetical protein